MNLDELYESGKINNYFFNKLKKNAWTLPSDLLDNYINDAIYMSSLGVSSLEDQNICYQILHNVPDIVEEIVENKLDLSSDVSEISALVYKNKSSFPIDGTFELFCAVAQAAKQLNIPLKNTARDDIEDNCSLNKKAYPQGYNSVNPRPEYNINKWMTATREIYVKMGREFKSFDEAEKEITHNWDKMEKLNFKYWLNFYNEGVPNKYPKLATAQFNPNFLQSLKSELPLPETEIEKIEERRKKVEEEKERLSDSNNVRVRIEDHRNKVISRLNSAEKLLASMDGQFFAGDEQEIMLKLLQDLKRKVQTSNKVNIKSSLFEDFIYRTGNSLKVMGASKLASNFFYKLAQDVDPFADPFAAGVTPPEVPDAASGMQSEDQVKQDTKQAFREFKELLDRGIYDEDDDKDEQQKLAGVNELIVFAQDFNPPLDINEDIPIGSAEFAPQADKPKQNRPKEVPTEGDLIIDQPSEQVEDIVTTEDDIIDVPVEDDLVVVEDDETDHIIEGALAHVTVNDAIVRLEMLLSIYKQREIPRQLSILDLMMDKLGFSSMFPQLGEAQTKALDAGGYITSRLEEILSALKGSALSRGADEWTSGKESKHTPEEKAIQQDLERKNKEEQIRKEKRKEKANNKLDNETDVVGDSAEALAQPSQVASTVNPIAVR